jgi:Cdc6-like AAA superfamily ATPase
METMKTWFGLKDIHSDFAIETDADARLFFARHDLDEQLQAILRRSFRSSNPPKFVLYGDWGVGKTHTMRHLEYVIATNQEFNARVVFVELPDISSKSRFDVAHAAWLDALGFDRARQWMYQYMSKHGESTLAKIRDFTQSGDIATAFANLSAFGDTSRIAWDWLRGVDLSAADSRTAGLPSTLYQSGHLVRVLQMFGRLCREVEGNLLVLMLDEATKLGYVSNQDAVNHWLNAFKLIADDQTKEIGLIVSISCHDIDEMALPLQDLQVQTRFGESNYIRLQNLGEQETRDFIKSLLGEWINPERRSELSKQYAAQAENEQIEESSFPFTGPALERVVQYACRNGGITTPRDIQKTVDDFTNRAIDDGRRILSSKYVTSLINA